MYGDIFGKQISVAVEGALLPTPDASRAAHVSNRYLKLWLELLLDERNHTDQQYEYSKEIRVMDTLLHAIWILVSFVFVCFFKLLAYCTLLQTRFTYFAYRT